MTNGKLTSCPLMLQFSESQKIMTGGGAEEATLGFDDEAGEGLDKDLDSFLLPSLFPLPALRLPRPFSEFNLASSSVTLSSSILCFSSLSCWVASLLARALSTYSETARISSISFSASSRRLMVCSLT